MTELVLNQGVPALLTPSLAVVTVQNTMSTSDDKLMVSTHGELTQKWIMVEPGDVIKFDAPMYLLQNSWNQYVFPVVEV